MKMKYNVYNEKLVLKGQVEAANDSEAIQKGKERPFWIEWPIVENLDMVTKMSDKYMW
jgi:hypothetical protein